MDKVYDNTLNQDQKDFLNKLPTLNVKQNTFLIYKGHIPLVSYYLVKGELKYLKSPRKEIQIDKDKVLIGALESLNSKEFELSVQAKTEIQVKIITKRKLEAFFEN